MKQFCYDQVAAPDGRFFAYESLEKETTGAPVVFFDLMKGDVKIETIALEYDELAKERIKSPYFLGRAKGSSHETFSVIFKTIPPYPKLKQVILDPHGGKRPVGPSSPRR